MKTAKCLLALGLLCAFAASAYADRDRAYDRSKGDRDLFAATASRDGESGQTCEDAIPISCGQVVESELSSTVLTHFYALDIATSQTLEIELLFSDSDSDLDLYLYRGTCDSVYEVDYSESMTDNESIVRECQEPGHYFIVVNNWDWAFAEYTLTLTCTSCQTDEPCDPFADMEVITETGYYEGTTDLECSSAINDYLLFGGFDGPEVAYELVLTEPTTLRFGTTGNYFHNVFLLGSQDPDDLVFFFGFFTNTGCLDAGTYYLVVDSSEMFVGDYELFVQYLPCDYDPCLDQSITEIDLTGGHWTDTGDNILAPDVVASYSGDVCYRLETEQPLAFTLTTVLPGTDYDTDVYLFADHSPCDPEFDPEADFVLYNDGLEADNYMAEFQYSCDQPLPPGEYYLILTGYYEICGDYEVRIDVENCGSAAAEETPTGFALEQNYPNPFNPSTSISFSLTETGPATLAVYNLAGQEVAVLASGLMEAGAHTLSFDASDLSSGVYVYTLQSDAGSLSKKMVLVR